VKGTKGLETINGEVFCW